jgi:hypothetical protein
MSRRSFAFAALALCAIFSGFSRADDKTGSPLPVVHTVIFYLKPDAPPEAADAIVADCHEMLAKVPTVRMLKAGRAADASPTKKGFGVGLVIFFDDAEGLKTYTAHPLHRGFVAKHLKNIETSKLGVYDFVDAKK